MTKLPSSPCGWFQESTRLLYKKLGFKSNVVPKLAHGRFRVDGWDIVVKRSTSTGRAAQPRLFADVNGRLVDVGRLRQALCARYVHRSRKKAKRQPRNARGAFSY